MSPTPSSSFSSSSGNYPFHRSHQHHHHSQYQSQQQNQHRQHLGHPSSPNPSLPTAAPSVLQSPLPQPFVPRPRAIANLPEEFEPSSSTTTSSVRGGVRGARSFSSPSSSIQLDGDLRGQLSPNNNRSFAVGSDAYLTGTMAHDTHSYGWDNRPSHPHFQPSSMGYDQPFPTTQSLAPDSVPLGFAGHAQQGSRNYYPSGGLSSHYLSVPSGGLSQGSHHPRSVSMSYAYPGNTVGTLPMPDQSFLPSPSYFMHQSDYYLPETTLPSHPTSIPASSSASPQPQPPHHHHQHPQTRPLYYYSPHSQHQNQHHLPPPTSATTPPLTTPTPTASTPTDQTAQDRPVRVLSFRPKPQCWEHGCNGREFSTFSNLLRHQREKSGVVAKAECPVCGAVFTRTTARNIHLAQGKCKGRDGSG